MKLRLTYKAKEMLKKRFNMDVKDYLAIEDYKIVDQHSGKAYPNVMNKFTSSVTNSRMTTHYWICERLNLQAPIDWDKNKLVTFYPLDGSYGYQGWTREEKQAIAQQRRRSSYNIGGTNKNNI